MVDFLPTTRKSSQGNITTVQLGHNDFLFDENYLPQCCIHACIHVGTSGPHDITNT